MYNVEVQFIIGSFVYIHLEIGGCESISFPEFLNLLPLLVDHLSENL